MRRTIVTLSTLLSYFWATTTAFAQVSPAPPAGKLNLDITGKVKQGVDPNAAPSDLIAAVLNLVFAAAILVVLFFLILGAFNWITSSGDKEKVGKARGMIVNALIGLAILALAFFIARVAGDILNINIFNSGSTIPTLPRP